jgi:hypothetical protein
MGDHSTETMELQSRRNNEAFARDRLLSVTFLHLDNIDRTSIPWILNHIDCFVSQSLGNKKVKHVHFNLHASLFNGHDDDVLNKVGQAVGNLQALKALHICSHNYDDEVDSDEDDEDEDADSPSIDWEIIARILRHVRQNVTVTIKYGRLRLIEGMQPFVRAICGHPTITGFEDNGMFPHESLETVFLP